jgi:hypothetical protein
MHSIDFKLYPWQSLLATIRCGGAINSFIIRGLLVRIWRGFIFGCGIAVVNTALPTVALADDLSITAQGTIGQSCSIAAVSSFPAPALGTAGSVSATATVDCNTGFAIHATSARGTIRTDRVPTAGFANSVPYSLTLSIPLDSGTTISGTCGSASLVAGQSACALSPAGSGLSSNGVSAIGRTAQLQVAWPAPTQSLVAGAYSDTITLSIAAQP